jgi:hypothetical protein
MTQEVRRSYAPPMNENMPHKTAQGPEHSLLRPRRIDDQPVGSAYPPDGALPSQTDALRHAGSTGHMGPARDPTVLEPIMQPNGAPGQMGSHPPNVLYGPPLPVYEGKIREDVAAKAFTTPRFPLLEEH